MRWTRGRSARIARGRRHSLRTAKACRPGALAAGAKFAEDDPQATVTQKPVSPGRARYRPLTPSRRECRCFGFICGDYTCALSTIAHKAAGAAKHPAFPAPSHSIEVRLVQSSGIPCRGNAGVCHCEERSDEAIQRLERGSGLLRCARNDESCLKSE